MKVFVSDPLNLFYDSHINLQKKKDLDNKLKNLNIKKSFKNKYINQLSISQFMITKNENIIKNIKSYFNDLKKYKNKTLSILIKDFLKSTIKTKRKILLLFLLSDDSDDEVKANILHELITKNEDVFLKKSCSHTIYNSYHWNIQKLFKTINKNVNEKKKN